MARVATSTWEPRRLTALRPVWTVQLLDQNINGNIQLGHK